MFTLRAFYKFTSLEALHVLRELLFEKGVSLGLKGILLIAPEGINSTISGTAENMAEFWDFLTGFAEIGEIEYKDSYHTTQPFRKLRVRVKREIITIRNEKANPSLLVGDYVEAKDWNDLIADPDVLLVDTRNHYEYVEGTFKGAIDPKTLHFSEFPQWVENNLDAAKHKKVAMFCTGGIRCEKASALLLNQGFEKVYHLKGGILKYLEEVAEDESTFEGSCFVFDYRDALVTGLKAEPRKFDQNNLEN
jgi:UPF0176 protein